MSHSQKELKYQHFNNLKLIPTYFNLHEDNLPEFLSKLK